MKISLNSKFLSGPYGGGMRFANFMREFLTRKGVEVVNTLENEDIDLILHINPFPDLAMGASAYSYLDAYKYKKRHPNTVIVERVNECDERKGTNYMNKRLVAAAHKSDFVVFIASWLRPLLLKAGLDEKKPWRVILNGADKKVFNTDEKEFWDGKNKIRIITHHWGDHPNKGHVVYKKLDELLEQEKYRDLFEFTFIGRIPKGFEYKNSRTLEPLSGAELAKELKKHHVYITASENEPAGMHHIEGALCGLPLLYINSGALPEYCQGYGLEFSESSLKEKLVEMRERYLEFAERIKSYDKTADKMAGEYLKLFRELYAKREQFAPSDKGFSIRKYIPEFLKYPLITLYILWKCLVRGSKASTITLNLAGVLPSPGSKKIIHGGKVKLLALRERFGDSWKNFNLAYFASSGLPFAPKIWLKIYRFFGIKTVWNQNGVAYPAWAGDEAERINSLMKPMHLADYVIYQTEFTKKCSDRFLGEYSGPSEILINPIDTEKFKPNPTAQPVEPFTIIMSGHHFESRERLEVSLEAVREVRRNGVNVRLVVGGNTQDLPEVDWIEIVGKFSQDEAPKLYHKAHILLHLKNLDPCPTWVLEALASGLPVVGLSNGGMPELVDEKSGVLVSAPENFEKFEYPTAKQVAEAIIKVRDNLQEFSKSARDRSLKFNKEIWLKRHEEIFNKLLQ
jgi:glycosyltransferase involved in cell wall biosynthesis